MKVSGTQSDAGLEVPCPPSHPQDSRVEFGEGGSLPQVTGKHKTWPTANRPPLYTLPGRDPREKPSGQATRKDTSTGSLPRSYPRAGSWRPTWDTAGGRGGSCKADRSL